MPEADFNLDAWLGQAEPLTKTVSVYRSHEKARRLQGLLLEAQVEHRLEAPGIEQRAAERKAGPARVEYERLYDEWADERLDIVVRAHQIGDWEEVDKAMAAAGVAKSAENTNIFAIARRMITPAMTPEQVGKFHDAIGPAQFDQIAGALVELDKTVVAPTAPLWRTR